MVLVDRLLFRRDRTIGLRERRWRLGLGVFGAEFEERRGRV